MTRPHLTAASEPRSEASAIAATTAPLTVVTVVKDDLDGLRRTLASIAASMPSAEVVVVEATSERSAGSLDCEHEMQRSLPFLRWVSGLDSGPYDGMNRGIRQATRPWVWFLNAGDTATPESADLSLLLRTLDAAWAVSPVVLVAEDGSSPVMQQVDHVDLLQWRSGTAGNFCHQGVIFGRHRLIELGGYDTRYRISSDYHLMLRFSLLGDPATLRIPLAVFRCGGLSTRRAGRLQWENVLARRDVLRPTRHFAVYDRLRALWRGVRARRRP